MPTETETEYVVTVKAGGSGGPKLQGVYTGKHSDVASKFAKVAGSENLLNDKITEAVLDVVNSELAPATESTMDLSPDPEAVASGSERRKWRTGRSEEPTPRRSQKMSGERALDKTMRKSRADAATSRGASERSE